MGTARGMVWAGLALLMAGCGWVKVESPGRPATPERATVSQPERAAAPPPARRTTTRAGGAAPVVRAPVAEPERFRLEAPDPDIPDGETTIVVRRGDTVYRIARASGRPVREIIERNGLEPPYRIVAGQRLALPARPMVHTVARGETLYGISRAYDVDTTTIARANRLEAPFHVQAGRQLVIPGGRADAEAPAPEPVASETPVAEARATGPVDDGADRRPRHRPDVETAAAPRTETETTGPARAPRPRPGGVQEAALRPAEREVPRGAIDAPPARSGQGFLTPVEGRIVADFGPQPGGLHNDGINIAAPRGTAVRASDDGVVAYVGDALPGFGNLILIKHADGWITAYAHNARLLVERGQIVRRGQTIASVGSTGYVGEPQLHFELRRGERAVDPRPYLFGSAG